MIKDSSLPEYLVIHAVPSPLVLMVKSPTVTSAAQAPKQEPSNNNKVRKNFIV